MTDKVRQATALHLTCDNKFFGEFGDKYKDTSVDYSDVRIIWEGVEYKYTLEQFKTALGLTP